MSSNNTDHSDRKYFSTTKKGDVHELKMDLNSTDKTKIKEAVKKVIAQMTLGQDVSTLFTDVIKNLQTENTELKKLIYLYIINYATSQPDKAILIVSTFMRDASDANPLIRALAIRTMGCIHLDRIAEYLGEPLMKALKDKDPYVRKTAALGVAKLYYIHPELVEEQGFLDVLRSLISDPNPVVVANAVAALSDVTNSSHKDLFQLNSSLLSKMVAALNECTEWGQVTILDCLANYEADAKEAEDIIERVIPRLKHVNSAVAMSAVKVVLKYLPRIQNKKLEEKLLQEKLAPPLITLLSEQKPEIQYVALRNINLIIQKAPNLLSSNIKHFFIKYNDPPYVKMEKLEIMVKLTNESNIEKVLMELKEYSGEVDVDFARKSVRAIGRCAVKLDKPAEKCVKVLLELIQTKVNYVVQEAIIVIKDIFRKYPNRYESVIATLCENLDTLDESEAKASMIWIIGEYADRIENSPELLQSFVDTFNDEHSQVQLQIVTAVVKLFLKRPDDAKEMVTLILKLATETHDNPDLRDRGYVYWRLLSTDPEVAQSVVFAPKATIMDDTDQLHPSILDVLIGNISTLASIYHKPPEFFLKAGRANIIITNTVEKKKEEEETQEEEEDEDRREAAIHKDDEEGDDEGDGGNGGRENLQQTQPSQQSSAPSKASTNQNNIINLNPSTQSSLPASTSSAASTSAGVNLLTDLLFDPSKSSASNQNSVTTPQKILLSRENGKGLEIRSRWIRKNNTLYLDLYFHNYSQTVLQHFAMKFNVNYLGLTPEGGFKVNPIAEGGTGHYELLIRDSKEAKDWSGNSKEIQMAIKTDLGIFYFSDIIEAYELFDDGGRLDRKQFLDLWKSIENDHEISRVLFASNTNIEQLKQKLNSHNMFFIAARSVQGKGEVVYFSFHFKSLPCLFELTINPSPPASSLSPQSNCVVVIKSAINSVSNLALNSIVTLLI